MKHYAEIRAETESDLKMLTNWTEQVHKMAQDSLYYLDNDEYEITEIGVLTPASRAILLQLLGLIPEVVTNAMMALRPNDPQAADMAWERLLIGLRTTSVMHAPPDE